MKSSALSQTKNLNFLPDECLECRLSSVLGLRRKILQCAQVIGNLLVHTCKQVLNVKFPKKRQEMSLITKQFLKI